MSEKVKINPPAVDALHAAPKLELSTATDNPSTQQSALLEFEKLKLLYENVAEQNRFYLSWRHKLVAGHLTSLAALFIATYTLLDGSKLSGYAVWPALGIALVSGLFMGLDRRNRELFKNAQNVGVAIEQKLGLNLYYKDEKIIGLFERLEKTVDESNPKKFSTHTLIIDAFYKACIGIGIGLGGYILLKPFIPLFN
jgi:hypothetical protein